MGDLIGDAFPPRGNSSGQGHRGSKDYTHQGHGGSKKYNQPDSPDHGKDHMRYSDLDYSSVFRFISDGTPDFCFIKIDDTTFINFHENETIRVDDEVFDGIFCNVEVQAWEPDIAQLEQTNPRIANGEDVEEGFEDYYEDYSEDGEIELIESDFFPDYELLVTIGDDQITEFTIHCWNTSDDPSEHKATLWFDGEHKMDSTRGAIEELMSLSADTLREMFGDF